MTFGRLSIVLAVCVAVVFCSYGALRWYDFRLDRSDVPIEPPDYNISPSLESRQVGDGGAGGADEESAAHTAPEEGTWSSPLGTAGDKTRDVQSDKVAHLLSSLVSASHEERGALLRGEGPIYDALFSRIAAELGEDEATFLMQLVSRSGDWDEVRALILEREAHTRQDYRELMLGMGLATGQIPVDDILALLNSGLSMPEGALHLLALHGRAEDIAMLAHRAPFPDLNSRDPVMGNTAIGSFVQHYSMAAAPDPDSAVAALQTLIDLGIDTRQAGGELDLLSHIFLNSQPGSLPAMEALSAYVIQTGVVTSPEELAIWNRISTPAEQQTLREAFEYLGNLPVASQSSPTKQ